MIVGVLKEIKDNENRVGATPSGVKALVDQGHEVLVERDAGLGSGFTNEEYESAGAKILIIPEQITKQAKLILKVKEPTPKEYHLFKPGQILFTYFHFASSEELTRAMIDAKVVCVAYETVETDDKKLPLLAPMSEVAGKMAAQMAAYHLGKRKGGKGILLSGVTGVSPAKVTVVGGGVVGTSAATVAAGMGANVTLLEISDKRIQELKKLLPSTVAIKKSTPDVLQELVPKTDVLIGAVLVAGAEAPKVVSKALVKQMEPGSVVVDVAIDQGGCIESSKPTSHSMPTYDYHGIIHYCVTNMPGQYPRTSTIALTNATRKYFLELADKGLDALRQNKELRRGLDIFKGKVTNEHIAKQFGLSYIPKEQVLKEETIAN